MLSAAESRRASDVTPEKAWSRCEAWCSTEPECFVIERLYTGWFCFLVSQAVLKGASLRPLGLVVGASHK